MKVVSRLLATVVAGLALGAVVPSQAALTLTPVGIAKGFTLSLFVDQVPNTGFCCGPLGIATNNIGQIVVQDWANKTNNVFLDVDNQHFSAKLSSAAFGASSYGSALTNSGGTLYATQNDVGKVFTLNPDGSVNAPLTAAGAGGHGIWTNPITGHLAAATGSAINDINPTTGAFTPIVSNIDVDGVSVAADGSVVYGATGGHVFGWNYTTGALVYDSGGIGSPDGTGVIQGNNLFSGDIIANSNDGNVWLLDPVHHTADIIAANGSRGDYVGIDGNNGTLFLTQTDSVYRLGCGPNCFFTPPVPEPETWALLLGGFGLMGAVARRRRGERDTT